MKGFTKLALDIAMGAVVPILILTNLTRPLGAPTAYVLAALAPVLYVLADTLFISRRFNVITTYIALSAIINGVLAFWFVDGVRFALKDTAAITVSVVVIAVSIAIGKPLVQYFLIQALNPDTPARTAKLKALLALPAVRRSVVWATWLVLLEGVAAGIINIALNLSIVTALFGTESFNQQVAHVNAITRIGFPIASLAAFGIGLTFVFRALYAALPKEEREAQTDGDIWSLIDLWQPGLEAG